MTTLTLPAIARAGRPVRTVLAVPWIGAARIIRHINRWRTYAHELDDYRAELAAKPDRHSQLSADRRARIAQRTRIIGGLIAGPLLVIVIMWAAMRYIPQAGTEISSSLGLGWEWPIIYATEWNALWEHTFIPWAKLAGASFAAAFLIACIIIGWPRNTPTETDADSAAFIDTTTSETAPITAGLIVEALESAVDKIRAALARNDRAIRFVGPVIKDGEGWAATVELPSGVEFADIAKARGRLASGLSRPKLAVLIERGKHEGEIRLWVGDDAPTEDVTWPYATQPQRVDVLKAFPIGEDPRGRPVRVTLRNQHGLIGAATGAGKTVTLRAIVAACVLDPRATVHIFDFKRSVGFVAFREAGAGVHVISGESETHIEQLRDTLASIKAEKARRDELVENLPPRDQPDGQIRSEDADRLGFGPLVVVLDEADVAFTDPTHGAEIGDLTEYLVRRGRSVSIHVILSTQNFNIESVPSVISSNASLRLCGRVASSQQSNLILGGDSAGEGYSGKDIEGRGSFWVRSSMGVPVFTRIANVTADDAWRIAEKARELRGDPQPAEPDPARDDTVPEPLRILANHVEGKPDDERVPTTEIAALLDVTAMQLAKDLKMWKIEKGRDRRPDDTYGPTGVLAGDIRAAADPACWTVSGTLF